MKIRVKETWKKNEVAVIEDQRTKFNKPGHSQMWITKIEQVNMSEVNCCKNNCSHVKTQYKLSQMNLEQCMVEMYHG